MPLPVAELEPGGIYEGTTGQQREIVALDTQLCKYRVTKLGNLGRNFLKVGETRTVSRQCFAEWADWEVA